MAPPRLSETLIPTPLGLNGDYHRKGRILPFLRGPSGEVFLKLSAVAGTHIAPEVSLSQVADKYSGRRVGIVKNVLWPMGSGTAIPMTPPIPRTSGTGSSSSGIDDDFSFLQERQLFMTAEHVRKGKRQ